MVEHGGGGTLELRTHGTRNLKVTHLIKTHAHAHAQKSVLYKIAR